MKHIFILNPAAGKGNAEAKILPEILSAVKNADVDYEVHRTINAGDAFHFVQNRCITESERAMRFYAVGGDGTLNEVVNGAYGYVNAEIGLIPAGTGNDFPRIFTHPKYFGDVSRQLAGKPCQIDLIRYNDRYLVNMLNIGLDCAVVAKTGELKSYPVLKGSLAYLVGVASVLGENRGYHMSVTLDDGTVEEGEFTLVAVGNGAFCGGGFKALPKALLNDGLLDVITVKKVTRRAFLGLIGKYRKGTHLSSPKAAEILQYTQCRSLKIIGAERLQICADGEISKERQIELEILPSAIRFSMPEGCELR